MECNNFLELVEPEYYSSYFVYSTPESGIAGGEHLEIGGKKMNLHFLYIAIQGLVLVQ